MSELFKPTSQVPVPADAQIIKKRIKRDGKLITVQIVRFRQRTGRLVEGELRGNGKCAVPSRKWYGRVRLANGRIRRHPLLENKEASLQLLARLQREQDQRAAGSYDEYARHQQRTLIGAFKKLPKRKPERDEWGRVVKSAAQLHREDVEHTIAGSHLADYRTYMESKGCAEKTVRETISKIRRACVACEFRIPTDVNPTKFREFVKGLKDSGRRYSTINAFIVDVKGFLNWMVAEARRLRENPLAKVQKLNEQADPRRRQRRSWTPADFAMLIAASEAGPRAESIPGPDRAMLYVLAAWTGYRRKELAAITLGHLSLDSDPPWVHVPAHGTKARRDDGPVPLHPEVASRLRWWLRFKGVLGPTVPLFPLRLPSGAYRQTARMMRKDCEAAGLSFVDVDGVADFHSHRVAFISNLSRTADFGMVVKLARHGDPKLTTGTYDRVRLQERAAAINGLPAPPPIQPDPPAGGAYDWVI
ncbi:MAG: tyrosine-type recombinase/integrase [Planctomycetota bacterium]|jgi:integrase